jgi:hypothetical protein
MNTSHLILFLLLKQGRQAGLRLGLGLGLDCENRIFKIFEGGGDFGRQTESDIKLIIE